MEFSDLHKTIFGDSDDSDDDDIAIQPSILAKQVTPICDSDKAFHGTRSTWQLASFMSTNLPNEFQTKNSEKRQSHSLLNPLNKVLGQAILNQTVTLEEAINIIFDQTRSQTEPNLKSQHHQISWLSEKQPFNLKDAILSQNLVSPLNEILSRAILNHTVNLEDMLNTIYQHTNHHEVPKPKPGQIPWLSDPDNAIGYTLHILIPQPVMGRLRRK